VVSNFYAFMRSDSGHICQAISFSVSQPASLQFDANLYYGNDCNPAYWSDRVGFGNPVPFGFGGGSTFWFIHCPDKTDMSATWQVGNYSSGCVNYANAPVESWIKECAAWHAQSSTGQWPGTLLVQVPLPLPRDSVNEQAVCRIRLLRR
jgi:hypothetical protein